jgi:cyclic-di-GMP phosphodiesterase TipF (flagellum assembly factor)
MNEVRVLQGLVEQLSTSERGAAEPGTTLEGVAIGGGRLVRGVPHPHEVITGLDDAQLLDIVREGLRSNRVDLFLQPIVSLPQRKRRFYECFSRIRAGTRGMLLPDQYLPVAEREGLIAAIDNMLLFRCVQILRRARRQNINLGFFVNISQHTLADTRFFRDFVAFMADNQELAPNLIFEFAQADIAGYGEAVMLELERLGRLGFRFSVDQISDLDLDVEALARRRVRFVKIEVGRLLERIEADGGVERLAWLKRSLDRNHIDLVVEKVESEQALVELLDLHIDFGQGYLFGEPRLSKSA